MNKLHSKYKAVDFFCGAGGVTCGFQQVGIKVLGGIDNDALCKETYEKNNDAKFIDRDISTLPRESLRELLDIDQNDDSLIFIGCSPCQYYTNLKTDKTKSKRTRLLLEEFQDFIEYYKPGYVFIENVPGIDTIGDSPLGKFKKYLTKNNYVFDEGVINAKYYEVPQNRRRYVLLATRTVDVIRLPKGNKKKINTVRDAIGDMQIFIPINAGHKDNSSYQHSAAKLSEFNLKRIKNTPINGGDRRSWAGHKELQLECYKQHGGHYDVYGRMYWDKPSPAITTRFCSLSNGRYGHPEQNRAISLREGATLQSFPLDYKFYSNSQGVISRMIGNAVPPALAKQIALSIVES